MVNESVYEDWFERLAEATASEPSASEPGKVSSRLKSRIFSAIMSAETAQGPLASLSSCGEHGRELCLWERLIQISPAPEAIKSLNHCYFCHARLMAEHFEGAPLPWRGCPYAAFQK